MKKLLSPLLFIFLIGFFVSCSKDEIDQSQDELINVQDTIIGVWEQDGFMEVSGQRLVFAADNSGLKIFRIVYSQDNIVSGLITFMAPLCFASSLFDESWKLALIPSSDFGQLS